MTSNTIVPFNSYSPRVAIVTGASQGLGRAIAHRLADDGIDVAINDLESQRDGIDKVVEEVRQRGRRAIAVPGDVTVEADVASLVEKTANELGSVDIMVANAGIFPASPFIETSADKFRKVLEVNTLGVFLSFKHAAIQMIKQGRGGRLIAASSLAGKKGVPNMSDYSASKFAVRGIVQSAALELQIYGITANAYAPGLILHPGVTAVLSDEMVKALEAQAPVGNPEDVASTISYLAKPEAYFINGQTINICGVGPGTAFD